MVQLFHSKDLQKRKEMQRILSALRWIELNKQLLDITEPINRLGVLPTKALLLNTNGTIPLIPLLWLNSRSENSRKILSGCRLASVIIYNGSNLHSAALISVLSRAAAIRHFPASISSSVESFQTKREKEMTTNNETHSESSQREQLKREDLTS